MRDFFGEYFFNILINCEIYLLLAIGLQMVLGWGGLFNLAHVALFGVGAYTTALLTVDYEWNTWVAIVLSPVMSILVSYPVYLISKRLRQDYFATGSLALSALILSVITNWKSVTHGVLGVPAIPRPSVLGLSLDANVQFIWVPSFFVFAGVILAAALRRSLFGKFLVAQAEFPEAVYTLGISPYALRSVTFALSAIYAGLAGAVFACFMSFIDPTSFALSEMVLVLAMVVLSGFQSVRALVGATLFLVCVPEALRFTELPSSILGPTRQLLFAVILFIVIYIRRQTLFTAPRRI